MTKKTNKADLFDFMLERVTDTGRKHGLEKPQSFGHWFLNMYFRDAQDIFISDGSKDGKVDVFFTTHDGATVTHHVMNTKFTCQYNKLAPVNFYQEITYFWRAFDNKDSREEYLNKAVKEELRPWYRELFKAYDDGRAELMFVTNHRVNENHIEQIEELPLKVFHLDDLIQHMIDDLDGAMPRTPPLTFTGIHSVPAPYEEGTEVHTSIVFARLVDFLKYMQKDPYDLLFMRNVRVPIKMSKSKVNQAIRDTLRENPKEFAFSNNGITLLCEKQTYKPGDKLLVLENPRVVNGSQTLHSIREVSDPSPDARVMVRIIEIAPPAGDNLEDQVLRRKDVISKIAVRSNQQNPIKKWNLVSNDDFQLDLYRLFRQKSLYYETRDGEWSQRSRELRSVGVSRGSNIKRLTQYIACFYWKAKKLGPANAKSALSELFEGETYDFIRQTAPELAYQLYLVADSVEASLYDLANTKNYISYLSGHIDLTLLALVAEALKKAGARWRHSDLTELLEKHDEDWAKVRVRWRELTKASVDHIFKIYKKDTKAFCRDNGYELTYTNYFKNNSYVSGVLEAAIPHKIVKLAKQVLADE